MDILNKKFVDWIYNPNGDENNIQPRVQFVIPCFQRDYVWDKDNKSGVCDGNCKRLIDDIYEIGLSKRDHFFGTLVLQKEKENDNYVIVDGQQRFITMFLIIKALSLITTNEDNRKYLNDLLMLDDDNSYINLDKRKDEDITTFNTIINIPYDYSQVKLIDNVLSRRYKEIFDYLKNKENIDIYVEGIKYLLNSEIVLNKYEDSQIIFERLNYNNARLKEYDLVLNYLLMNEGNRDFLYKNYWIKIENNVGQDNLESFIHNYVMSRKGEIVNEDKVFEEYRKYVEAQRDNDKYKREALKDLYNCSEVYRYILCRDLNDSEKKESWVRLTSEINRTNILTVYPFLIKLFECKEFKPIIINGSSNRKEELNKILNLILVFIVKSRICGVTSNKYRQLFVNLYQSVYINDDNNKDKYVSIYNYFKYAKKYGFGEYIFEDKFIERLLACELYHKSALRDVILNSLEDGRYPTWHKERVILDEKRRVEHIFPQTPKEEYWNAQVIKDLSPRKHCIGNLSFIDTSSNTDASNKSYDYKLSIYKKSKFTLNKNIASYPTWNLDNFNTRNKDLVSQANGLFKVDSIDEIKENTSLFEKCNVHPVTKINYELFTGAQPIAIKHNNKIKKVYSFYEIGKILAPSEDYRGSAKQILKHLLKDNYIPQDLIVYTKPNKDELFKNRETVGKVLNEIVSNNANYFIYKKQYDGDRNFIVDTVKLHGIFGREEFKYNSETNETVDTSGLIYFNIKEMNASLWVNTPNKELETKLTNNFSEFKKTRQWNMLYSKEFEATKESILDILIEIDEIIESIK